MFSYQLTLFLCISLSQSIQADTFTRSLNGSENVEPRKIWALITAGSKGWINYRHQAGACHAFHTLKNHGIPEEQIILMMYDDIAYHKNNPNPGTIINKPNGTNVYEGVKIDYNGSDVTPQNFLAILQGDRHSVKGGSGRVIKSTANDNIFVYFVDHGATGLIEFPDAVLTLYQLNNALQTMNKQKKYNEMLFYIEACESGSMFKHTLPNNTNVYAVTSAEEGESAWACYCDDASSHHMPCLGDIFSVSWMENADRNDLKSEKLKTQVDIARKAAKLSHVMEYGNTSISDEYAADFEGGSQPTSLSYLLSFSDFEDSKEKKDISIMPVREIPVIMLKKKLKSAKRQYQKASIRHKIKNVLKKRNYLKRFFTKLLSDLIVDNEVQKQLLAEHPITMTNLQCFDDIIQAFQTKCFNFTHNSYALKYVYVLANICEQQIPTDVILEKLTMNCSNIQHHNIH